MKQLLTHYQSSKKVTKRLIGTLFTLMLIMMNQVNVAAAPLLSNVVEIPEPEQLSSTLQLLVFLTFLTFIPAIVLGMTSFTRIIIVFSLLRTALGTTTTPPNQVLIGIAMFLTFFIMAPVIDEIKTEAIDPYIAQEISDETFIEEAKAPIRSFMLKHTRKKDLDLFVDMSGLEIPNSVEEFPLHVVVPAFIISELKIAFEISFLLFVPFLVIDFVVSSVLMSMGMMMLPPAMIALPFKILLFVLVDGWNLIVQSLVESFMK